MMACVEMEITDRCLYLWGNWDSESRDTCWEWEVGGREAPCDLYTVQ